MVVLDGMLCHAVGIAVIGVSRVFYPDGMPMYVKRKCMEKAVNGVFRPRVTPQGGASASPLCWFRASRDFAGAVGVRVVECGLRDVLSEICN